MGAIPARFGAAGVGSRPVIGTRARRWLAMLFGIATAVVFEDVLVCWINGAPARAWGLVELSPMRLASFFGVACALAGATWLCAAGVPDRWAMRLSVFALFVNAAFLGNGRYIGSEDVAATRLVPFELVREGRLCFEGSQQLPAERNDRAELPYWFVQAGPHVVSRYPVATGVLAVPAYVPAIAGGYDPKRERVHELERIAAACLALAGVLIVAAIARRWLGDTQALAVAGIYAFGTSVATVLSKALWQHSGGAFGFALALAGIFLAQRTATRATLLGLGLGIAIASRSTNAAPALFVGLAALFTIGARATLLAALVALVPLAAQGGYAAYYFGSITGHGYGREATEGWTAPWGEGLAGLLASPGRGLLVYSPCVAFAAVALTRADGERIDRRTGWALLAAIAAIVLVMGKWWCWWGGGSPGERMTSDVAPLWGVGLALAWARFGAASGVLRGAWLASCAYACVMQTMISFVRPGSFATAQFFRVMSGPWSWQAYAPLTYVLELLGR